MKDRAARQAKNEALHREVNERLAKMGRQANLAWASNDEPFEFLCECGAAEGCEQRLEMKLTDYERVRQQDDRFAVAPGHEDLEIERVVDRNDAFVIVDKIARLEPYVADDP